MANLYARSLGYKVEITQKIKRQRNILFRPSIICTVLWPLDLLSFVVTQLTSFDKELSIMTSPGGIMSNSNKGSSELKTLS